VNVDFDTPWMQRAVPLTIVILFHVLIIALLISQTGLMRMPVLNFTVAHIVPQAAPRPKPPEVRPVLLSPPPPVQIPVPEVNVAPPPARTAAPRAVMRAGPHGPPASHFGAAGGDAGLGIDAATTSGGGAGARGSLGDWQAAVKGAVLRRKRQPTLAWDRRSTCVVNYSVTVTRGGSLARFNIDPCGVPEINQAARDAIRAAAPFPTPPDLGAATATVQGTLIFYPQ
jgi:protein TonB